MSLEVRLPLRPPLAWAPMISFLRARAIPSVEAVEGSCYRRTVSVGGSAGVIELDHVPTEPHVSLRSHLADVDGVAAVVERARGIFDLDADSQAIGKTLRRDPALAPFLERHPGLRVPGAWDPFELAVRAVLGQQVSVQAATTLAGRLVSAFGEPLDQPDGVLTHLFPSPRALAQADLASIGMPRARADTIRLLAVAIAKGDLVLTGSDPEELVGRLQALPGIGPWTAQYVAMRALRRPDAFPASDLGLRHALSTNGRSATPDEVERRAEAWRPWRAYAAMYLWTALADPKAA